MLEIKELVAGYRGVLALDGVSMALDEGETITVLGPNGAGKSTLMACLMGLVSPESGTVHFRGERINGLSTREIVRRGIVLCPERRHLFPGMTVRENLWLGAYLRKDRSEISRWYDEVMDLFPRLRTRVGLNAGVLSGGEQQMVAVGRALMGRPELLMLDEPSLGLAPNLVESLMDALKTLTSGGLSICLVEQNATMALEIASRAYVLESGRVVLEGSSEEIASDDRIQNVYLGQGR
jgi:branched-chain amino acid transport system ATP-binding protein